MQSRRRSIIVHAIWAIAGGASGITVALLLVKGFEPEWIEATGTWFGAIATVLALLWAVQTFRSDQAEREAQRRRDAESEREALAAAASAHKDEAAKVVLAIRGGAGYGTVGEQKMSSIHIDFHNDSQELIVIEEVEVDAPLILRKQLRMPIRVPANWTHTELMDIEDIGAMANELSGQPLERFGARMTYRVGPRRWTRATYGAPASAGTAELF